MNKREQELAVKEILKAVSEIRQWFGNSRIYQLPKINTVESDSVISFYTEPHDIGDKAVSQEDIEWLANDTLNKMKKALIYCGEDLVSIDAIEGYEEKYVKDTAPIEKVTENLWIIRDL